MEPLHIAVPPRAICSGSDLETGYRHAAGDLPTPRRKPRRRPRYPMFFTLGPEALRHRLTAVLPKKSRYSYLLLARPFTMRSERDAIVMRAPWVRQLRGDEWMLMAETWTWPVIVVSRMLYCAVCSYADSARLSRNRAVAVVIPGRLPSRGPATYSTLT
jgi:hypothetical protein